MRWRGSVRGPCLSQRECKLADLFPVFRAAHDSSKAMRLWMGELKKKS
jgi:hypothetical protein